jgi:hypothetical protein
MARSKGWFLRVTMHRNNLRSNLSQPRNYRWLVWLPSVVLVIVAIAQCGLVASRDLVPWKGGGFGMFSCIDAPSSRRFSFHGYDAEGNLYLLNVAFSDSLDLYLRCYPDDATIRSLASELVDGIWVPDGHLFEDFFDRADAKSLGPGLQPPSGSIPRILRQRGDEESSASVASGIQLTSVQVQLWRFDLSGERIVWEAIRPAIEVKRES